MSTQFIQGKYAGTEKVPTAIHNDSVGRSLIKFLPKNAGIAYDLATGDLKYNANGTIRTISSTTATLLGVVPQAVAVDLDGTNWHNGVGGKHDLITWDVPEDIVITRVIVATKDPSDHTMALLLLLVVGQSPVGTLITGLDLGSGPVCVSNFDTNHRRHAAKAKKDKDDDTDEEPRRELFAPKGSRLEFRASDDPTGLVGKALIFYVEV